MMDKLTATDKASLEFTSRIESWVATLPNARYFPIQSREQAVMDIVYIADLGGYDTIEVRSGNSIWVKGVDKEYCVIANDRSRGGVIEFITAVIATADPCFSHESNLWETTQYLNRTYLGSRPIEITRHLQDNIRSVVLTTRDEGVSNPQSELKNITLVLAIHHADPSEAKAYRRNAEKLKVVFGLTAELVTHAHRITAASNDIDYTKEIEAQISDLSQTPIAYSLIKALIVHVSQNGCAEFVLYFGNNETVLYLGKPDSPLPTLQVNSQVGTLILRTIRHLVSKKSRLLELFSTSQIMRTAPFRKLGLTITSKDNMHVVSFIASAVEVA